ncbi:dihydrolipoamide acetyltransferase family protein [Bacillus sp. N1-1]|jgi:pyruvate dehydrogenase E2 component (dihydrolipoamide acetyltransferase)|uniref:dihydrolipoamide acetyltransferase family protein n=1 Tax=Bacillus sp. N1-1 TaxID=2682541 RepID=UPI001315FE7E|nr:dihydrolipoamide acetyltransferase family protein [Bacillus sp. N1-1]QHA90767.1 2-oxo acid dehydrogenase subunit E2 [Bacillus sp. N1-1]
MSLELIMPKLGMSMEEGTLVEWLKEKGAPVKKGETIAVISSDKIEKDIESPGDGFLIETTADINDVVPVGQPIGYIGEESEQVIQGKSDSIEARAETASAVEVLEKPEEIASKKRSKIRISPAAKKLASKESINVDDLTGTGPNGRVTRVDVEKAMQMRESAPSEKRDRENSPEKVSKPVKMTGMRKVIAERMYNSLQNSAQLTITMKADVTSLMEVRKQSKRDLKEGNSLTVTDFIAKATIIALQDHPQMNSSLGEGEILLHEDIHLGLAVALEKGLMVPVVRRANTLTLGELSNKIKQAGKHARDGVLDREQLTGSTFTITSLGNYGIEFFTPILNPPETGILGIGTAEEVAVFEGDNVVKRIILPLSLTFDHRVIDGAPAATFLNDVKSYLEAPLRLLI